jgi:hypothetical protein
VLYALLGAMRGGSRREAESRSGKRGYAQTVRRHMEATLPLEDFPHAYRDLGHLVDTRFWMKVALTGSDQFRVVSPSSCKVFSPQIPAGYLTCV